MFQIPQVLSICHQVGKLLSGWQGAVGIWVSILELSRLTGTTTRGFVIGPTGLTANSSQLRDKMLSQELKEHMT